MNEAEILTLQDTEKAYMLLSSLYLLADCEHQRSIREKWNYGYAWKIPNQTRLSCIIGERYSIKERIEASLVYDSLENCALNRESLISLAIVYHSCILAKLDPSVPFLKVAQASSKNVASRFINFLRRNPKDISLEAFMLKPRKDNNGEWEIPCPF